MRTALDLKLGSFFKFSYFAALAFLLPLSLFFGILAAGGANTVRMNGTFVHGLQAIVISALLPFLMSLVLSAWLCLGTLILRFFANRSPRLRFKSDDFDARVSPDDA